MPTRASASQMGPGTQGREFLQLGTGLDARIHRMFFKFRRMQAEIPAPSRRKWKDKQRGREGACVDWLSFQFWLMSHSPGPCQLGSIAPVCEMRKSELREVEQLAQSHTADVGSQKGRQLFSNFPFARAQEESRRW